MWGPPQPADQKLPNKKRPNTPRKKRDCVTHDNHHTSNEQGSSTGRTTAAPQSRPRNHRGHRDMKMDLIHPADKVKSTMLAILYELKAVRGALKGLVTSDAFTGKLQNEKSTTEYSALESRILQSETTIERQAIQLVEQIYKISNMAVVNAAKDVQRYHRFLPFLRYQRTIDYIYANFIFRNESLQTCSSYVSLLT